MNVAYLGNYGSDAGGWYIGPDGKIHHFEGWGVDRLSDVRVAVAILDLAAKFKNPALAEAVTAHLGEFVQKEVGAFAGNGRAVLAG